MNGLFASSMSETCPSSILFKANRVAFQSLLAKFLPKSNLDDVFLASGVCLFGSATPEAAP